jgi:hypothetical protein
LFYEQPPLDIHEIPDTEVNKPAAPLPELVIVAFLE